MNNTNIYPKYACRFCGSTRKLVETIIDDEFIWNDKENHYEPNNFTDEFEHTGGERCAKCHKQWTGIHENAQNWVTHKYDRRRNWSPGVVRNSILRYSKKDDGLLDSMIRDGTTEIEANIHGIDKFMQGIIS